MKLHKPILTLLTLCLASLSWAQSFTVTGTVKEKATQDPAPGVAVSIEGTTVATATDANGRYAITVSSANDVLVFSCIGFASEKTAVGNRRVIDIQLSDEALNLDETVVIGYGKTTKKEITGSVTSLKPIDFAKGTFTNAAGMLQGKVAGLTVVNPAGGDPNGKYEILLRGTNTLSAGQGPLIIIDGVAGADIRNINFQEVESIDVLKDGSAAAIYGTRGTNGVIIITTRRAAAGSTSVQYDGQLSVQYVTRRAEPLSAERFAYAINTYKPAASGQLYGSQTDWFKEITRTPISLKNTLSVSGGSEKFSHHTVLNIERNEGLQLQDDGRKYLMSTNIRQRAIQGWIDLDYNLMASKRQYHPANYSAFEQAFIHNPTEPVYDPSNEVSGGYYRIVEMGYYNPVAMVKERDSEQVADDLGANVRATLNIKPVDGLKWDNFLSYHQQRYEGRDYRTRYYPSSIGKNGDAEINNEYSHDLQYESTLSYSHEWGNHNLQAIAGYTYEKQGSQYSYMENYGFDTDDFRTHNIGAGTAIKDGMSTVYSYKEASTYIAFFGRVMYNYDERYLLSVSLRRDGSSRFGKDHKWGWFPAVSLGWRLVREAFMEDAYWIDDLKLRAGFGMTGNQDFSNYQSLMLMEPSGKFYYNGQWINTYAPASNPNPDLGWERKSEYNLGLDFAFLGSRLRGSLDGYYRLTSDLLYNYKVPTPPYVYDELFTNVGSISNWGIELSVSGDIVKRRNVSWTATAIWYMNRNRLEKFTNEEFKSTDYKVGWVATPVGAYLQRLEEGKPLGSFYGPVWLGVNPDTGEDILKNSIGSSVPESRWEYLGNAQPLFQASLSNALRYKGFDLSFSWRASVGGKVFNSYAATYENITSLGLKNVKDSWLNNPEFTGNVRYSSKYVEDASYLKLDDIGLGYTKVFANPYLNRLRVSLTAQNLVCITPYSGVDPEVSLSGLAPGIEGTSYYPRTASLTLGLQLVF